jgi:hypothetical protein
MRRETFTVASSHVASDARLQGSTHGCAAYQFQSIPGLASSSDPSGGRSFPPAGGDDCVFVGRGDLPVSGGMSSV